MSKKLTKKDLFEKVKGELVSADLIAFIDHEIELVEKKNKGTKKPTKTQVENEGLKNVVLGALTNEPKSVSDIQATNADLSGLSNQKISALLTQLVNDNKIVRIVIKKKSHFSRV